jgi:hypothetical protein
MQQRPLSRLRDSVGEGALQQTRRQLKLHWF